MYRKYLKLYNIMYNKIWKGDSKKNSETFIFTFSLSKVQYFFKNSLLLRYNM